MDERTKDIIRLRHVVNAATEILEFVKNKSHKDLVKDRILTLAWISHALVSNSSGNKEKLEFS